MGGKKCGLRFEIWDWRFIMLRMMNIGGVSAIRASSIALTFVDLERDSAVFEQVHTALAAYSVRLARCLRFFLPFSQALAAFFPSVSVSCSFFQAKRFFIYLVRGGPSYMMG